jgi:hypothetical protein
MPTDDRLAKLLQKNIEASNRTTHAVRALVRFLFIQLSFLTAAAVLWQVGLAFPDESNCSILGCEPNGLITALAVLLVITGVILSSIAGWDELGKSDVTFEDEDAYMSEEERAKAEVLRKAEQEREEKETLRLEAEAKLALEQMQKEEEALRIERRKKWDESMRKFLAVATKPWVLGVSVVVPIILVASGIGYYVNSTSWQTLVKECDSLMTKSPLSVDDSYTLNSSNDELTLIVGIAPRDSEWVDCIGNVLSGGSPNGRLGRTVENKLRASQDSIVFRNLQVLTQKLDGDSYQIQIRPTD